LVVKFPDRVSADAVTVPVNVGEAEKTILVEVVPVAPDAV
jgi:hypothetical protein